MNLVIHIGLNRTGTSALQNFFATHRSSMRELGFFYPLGPGASQQHHGFASLSEAELGEAGSDLRAQMVKGETLLLSSEAFGTQDAARFRQLLKGFDVSTVVYLREHVDYLKSWWAFDVASSTKTTRLADFAWLNRNLSYSRIIQSWPNVEVVPYSRSALMAGSIVQDFLSRFAPALVELLTEQERSTIRNSSITGNLLYLKFLANSAIPHRHERQTADELLALAGELGGLDPLPALDASFESHLWQNFSEDRRFVSALASEFSDFGLIPGGIFPNPEILKEDYSRTLDLANSRGMLIARYLDAIEGVVGLVRAGSH